MANKQRIGPYKVITAGDMVGDLTSQVMDIRGVDNISFQYVWTGAPTGGFVLQASLDGTTFNTIPGLVLDSPAGVAGSFLMSISSQAYAYVRTVYTRVAGTGTLNVWFSAHSAGG